MCGLIEPAPALEITCSGLAGVHVIGGGIGCFLLYRHTIPLLGGGEPERHLVGRIFAPVTAIPEAMEVLTRAGREAAMAAVRHQACRLLS